MASNPRDPLNLLLVVKEFDGTFSYVDIQEPLDDDEYGDDDFGEEWDLEEW